MLSRSEICSVLKKNTRNIGYYSNTIEDTTMLFLILSIPTSCHHEGQNIWKEEL
jgi:hypothetical protein